MRFIPTRVHGMMDYIVGVILILAPWILGFPRAGVGTWLPVILGIGVIGYSMLTNYELGVWPGIPMTTHLTLDVMGGILLAVSPWLFGFSHLVWAPHLFVGLFEIATAMSTQTTPGLVRHRHHGHGTI